MTLRASSSPMERHCQIFVDWEWRWNLWASRAVERVGRKVRNGCTPATPQRAVIGRAAARIGECTCRHSRRTRQQRRRGRMTGRPF